MYTNLQIYLYTNEKCIEKLSKINKYNNIILQFYTTSVTLNLSVISIYLQVYIIIKHILLI